MLLYYLEILTTFINCVFFYYSHSGNGINEANFLKKVEIASQNCVANNNELSVVSAETCSVLNKNMKNACNNDNLKYHFAQSYIIPLRQSFY